VKVVLLARNDYTRLGAEYARSLRSIGIDADMFVQYLHQFEYPDQGNIFKTDKDILPYIKEATIIHFMHSQNPIPKIDLKGKKVVVSHTGTAYRKRYRKINKIFNPIVDLTIVGADLFGKGAKNEYWIESGIVDTEKLRPVYERSNNILIVGHFPSKSANTGSTEIIKIMKNIKGNFEFRYSDKAVPWEEQIKRMSECDVYLERLTKNSGFGITVLEAAALGKIVFTPYAFENKYRETIGEFDLINIKSADDLIAKTEEFISLPNDKLLEMKKKSRAWVEKHHSHKVVGEKLLNLYKKIL